MIDYDDWDDKPIPIIESESEPYWHASREERLVVQYCEQCDSYQFYPRSLCKECWSEELSFRDVPGTGTVHTYTVTHRPGQPGYENETPYNLALIDVELPENKTNVVRMLSHIVECDEGDLEVGLEVEVTFKCIDESEEVYLPVFRPR